MGFAAAHASSPTFAMCLQISAKAMGVYGSDLFCDSRSTIARTVLPATCSRLMPQAVKLSSTQEDCITRM